MDFYDDSFDSIVREFFGDSRRVTRKRDFIRGEEEERTLDFVELGDSVYLVFELPGFSEEDVRVSVQGGTLAISAQKKYADGVKEYLSQKLSAGVKYTRTLPDFINPKTMKHTFNHGILEVFFEKK